MSPNGRLFSAIAALLLIVSAFLPWVTTGNGTSLSPAEISSGWALGFGGDRGADNRLGSMLLPLVVGALLLVLAAVIRSAAVAGLAGVGVVVVVVLWWVQANQDIAGAGAGLLRTSSLTIDGAIAAGPVIALVAGVLAILCALFMRQREKEIITMGV